MSTSVEESLANLKHLLSNLPDTVPSAGNIYDFGFLLDTMLVELYGTRKAALNIGCSVKSIAL